MRTASDSNRSAAAANGLSANGNGRSNGHPGTNGNGHAAARLAPEPAAVMQEPLTRSKFIWGAGVECSFIPHLDIDQYQWTQHDRYWKEDLRHARETLGIEYLRYCFPWHVLELERGRFDWSYADERLDEFERLGIRPMLDVMHFGTPRWLKQAVGDPEFPEALESFTHAIVSRYAGRVPFWCPFNEPLVSALFSGDFGFWPPHGRKWRGYMPVLSRITQGVARGIRAIRRADPNATVVHVDTVEHYKTRDSELQSEVARRNARRFVVMDLLTGRVDHHHPLYEWLTAYGMSELDLEWFRTNPQRPDVLGMDYYPHGDWQLEYADGRVRQKRADNPFGLYRLGHEYYNRYGIPLMVTETSVDGQPLNREIWLEQIVEDCRRLRADGVPMLGLIWWPLLDQIDWDGALTHRVGKVHEVGLIHLTRQKDGVLRRENTPLVDTFRKLIAQGDGAVGQLTEVAVPVESMDEQLPPLAESIPSIQIDRANGAGQTATVAPANRQADPAPGIAGEPAAARAMTETQVKPAPKAASTATATEGGTAASRASVDSKSTDRYGIVVFCHLRWGFVWQRPQQFLSRFARKHKILFVEEPMFDLPEGKEGRVELHRVMPNVTVACPHLPRSLNGSSDLPAMLRTFTRDAIDRVNEEGDFDRPLLWYYSPMDSAWSLGAFENRGVVYDCMDELSQFTGAPPHLLDNEARLMRYADIVFTGGYEMGANKRRKHDNVHVFGCGVEFDHFAQAQDRTATIPADIDFMTRPILGWFGVVDERVDYGMIGEMARKRPDWSFAMVGPVVKVDPNHLPHSPNLYWLGGRDYQQLPHYCRAFDINMMCFALNKATEYINPTKGLEYMATGKPIVSSPVRDVVRQWSDIVYLAKGADEWIEVVEKALQPDNPDRDQRVRRGLDLARQCSWESTVQTMQNLIQDAIGRKDRPSAQRIEPLSAAELNYTYISTPGS